MTSGPGIYAFHLRAIRRATVGLRGRGPFDGDTLESAKRMCLDIVDRMLTMHASRPYTGHMKQLKLYDKHRTVVNVNGQLAYTNFLHDTVSQIDAGNVLEFIIGLEDTATLVAPIYVGITTDQTLLERYRRHESNYMRRVRGTFGNRLAQSGFSWSDIIFSCSQRPLGAETMRSLENYLQFLSRPILGES